MSRMTATGDEHYRGFCAVDKLILDFLKIAEDDLPKRRKQNRRKADYRMGYFDGLLAAHCFMALGHHPLNPQNAYTIMNVLRDSDAAKCKKAKP
jgi:hypothetical protein